MTRSTSTAKKSPASKASSSKSKTRTTAKSAKPANTNKSTATSNRSKSSSQSSQTLLRALFVDSIKDMYWAEKHLTKTLPKMRKAATSEELQACFEDHLAVTETHVERLEEIFAELGIAARGKKCEAMAGLALEGQEIVDSTPAGTATRDVGLILAAQKVEHYEIASYGGLAQLARTLGEESIAGILEDILSEEKEADMLLTQIAENDINYEAEEEDEE